MARKRTTKRHLTVITPDPRDEIQEIIEHYNQNGWNWIPVVFFVSMAALWSRLSTTREREDE